MADMDTTAVDPAEVIDTTHTPKRKRRRPDRSAPPPSGGAVYGLGMIGALVYFVGTAESPSGYLFALGKAIVWPALLVYKAFRLLGD